MKSDQNADLALGLDFLCAEELSLIDIVVEDPVSTGIFYLDSSKIEALTYD